MANSQTMNVQEASAYLGMTCGQFRRAVDRGEIPGPIVKCRPALWSTIQLQWVLEGKVDNVPVSCGVPTDVLARINAL